MKRKYCAGILIFSICIFSAIFYSCNNTSETKLVYTESDTIKKSVKEKEQTITWTQELEEDRLSKRITRSSMTLGADVVYSKELFKISNQNKRSVYPDLPDFGSLDTRNINDSLKEKLNNFCKNLSSENHAGADSFFSRKYIFNYVFFVKDLEEGWKKNFGVEYPKTEKPAAEVKLSDSSSEVPEAEVFSVFTKWTFGEPFIGSEIMQIPVRFYSTCGIIDVTIFINSSGNNEFYQITIDRWKKV